MKIWSLALENIRYGKYMPAEDHFLHTDSVFCVADGVTRDPIGVPDFTGKDIYESLEHYPNPSPATQAAKTCCETFIAALENSKSTVREALCTSNASIAKLNQNISCDYLEHDFGACVAIGAKIVGGILYWAGIGDCQLSIFSQDGTRKFTSPDGTEKWAEYEYAHPGNWNTPDYRVIVRRDFRNNPAQAAAFGVLTGEKTVESFIMSGEEKLEPGDYTVLYSDGFTPFVNLPEFAEKVRDATLFLEWQAKLAEKEPTKFGKERTMIFLT